MIFSLLLLSNAINHHIVPMVNEMVLLGSTVRTSINHNHVDVASLGFGTQWNTDEASGLATSKKEVLLLGLIVFLHKFFLHICWKYVLEVIIFSCIHD